MNQNIKVIQSRIKGLFVVIAFFENDFSNVSFFVIIRTYVHLATKLKLSLSHQFDP